MSTLPAPSSTYLQALLAAGVTPPLRDCPDEPRSGVVVDLKDRPVFTVDVNRELPDAQAHQIAMLVVAAVNAMAGFSGAARDALAEAEPIGAPQ